MIKKTNKQTNKPCLVVFQGFPGPSVGQEFTFNALDGGDVGSIPGSRRSQEKNGTPVQYSCLEKSMERGA